MQNKHLIWWTWGWTIICYRTNCIYGHWPCDQWYMVHDLLWMSVLTVHDILLHSELHTDDWSIDFSINQEHMRKNECFSNMLQYVSKCFNKRINRLTLFMRKILLHQVCVHSMHMDILKCADTQHYVHVSFCLQMFRSWLNLSIGVHCHVLCTDV